MSSSLKDRLGSTDQGRVQPPSARRRPVGRALRAVAVALGLVVALSAAGCAPASVTFTGHGYGHGRGMGQWGALGYAVDHGWSGTQILNHYYGGTATSGEPNVDQRVYLTATRGQELRVMQGYGALRVDGYGGTLSAVRIARVSANRFRVWGGSSCTGGWILIGDRSASEVHVRSGVLQGNDPARMMQLCTSTGTRYYRGSLRAVEALSTIVTVNQVSTELLLRSVVAQEMSPSWAGHGGGKGAIALRVQAVAARSYVRAGDGRWGTWASTCDSTQCQAYPGYASRANGSSTLSVEEDARTDLAVSQTAFQVRRFANGRIASTEFSASTGGWTAGGTFPAVVDAGDDYAPNPNHNWTVSVTRAAIETAFDRRQGRDMGTFSGFESYVRNGLGDQGGRVTSVRARFSGGDVTVTGEQLRLLLGLRSSWFATSTT